MPNNRINQVSDHLDIISKQYLNNRDILKEEIEGKKERMKKERKRK